MSLKMLFKKNHNKKCLTLWNTVKQDPVLTHPQLSTIVFLSCKKLQNNASRHAALLHVSILKKKTPLYLRLLQLADTGDSFHKRRMSRHTKLSEQSVCCRNAHKADYCMAGLGAPLKIGTPCQPKVKGSLHGPMEVGFDSF